jgi:hypothetical protein
VLTAGDHEKRSKPKEKEVDAESGNPKEGQPTEKDEPKHSDGEPAKTEANQAGGAKAALAAFNDLQLSKIDDLKDKLPQPRSLGGGQQMGPQPPIVLAAALNKIFVGSVQNRDMRTGQPLQVKFKVFVEEMSTVAE